MLIGALALGVVWFAWRGPWRGLQAGGLYDFKLIYSGARAWLVGSNPYDYSAVLSAWRSAGGAEGDPALVRPVSSLVYAPPAFVVLAPVAALPWPAAGIVWTLLNLALFGLAVAAVDRLAGLRGDARLGFWAAAFWLAPFGTGFSTGQLSLLVMTLVAAGHLLRVRGGAMREFAAGALLGAGTVLKPQLGLLFLVYEAGRLRWRALLGAVAAAAVLLLLGAGRLAAGGVGWLSRWREHMREFSLEDGDPTRANPVAYQQYQLSYPLHTLTDDRMLVQGIVLGVLGGLSLAYFVVDLRRQRQRGEGRAELVSLSMVSVVTLLITYHRLYDAVLLLFPVALGIWLVAGEGAGERGSRRLGAVLLVLLIPFAAPGSVILKAVEQRGVVPDAIASSLVWEAVLVPHATWSLLAACVVLVVIRGRLGAGDQSTP